MSASRMIEAYCAEIEALSRNGELGPALRMSLALPDMSAALEDGRMASSPERYGKWCENWLRFDWWTGRKPIEWPRVYRLYQRSGGGRRVSGGDTVDLALRELRMMGRVRRQRTLARPRMWYPSGPLEAFRLRTIESLVAAARDWYRDSGAQNLLVQQNLGRLSISG